jgi:two-component system phosphate regulon sensor histidine kinase PhoR
MKRVFPIIVLLITLSVVGILFIQMQWIQNAMAVKRDQFEQYKTNAIRDIRTAMNNLYLEKYYRREGEVELDDALKERLLRNNFTATMFTKDEITPIIQKALRNNNIKDPYEFNIIDSYENTIISSDNFSVLHFEKSTPIRLNTDNLNNQEILYLYIRESNKYIISNMGWMIAASIILTTIIISAFALTVRTLFNQKKLSEIKSDFINNMTHELKTPLATISLAVDALNNHKVINDEEKIRYYSGMIREENKRMNKQVETILQAARIERQEISLNLQELNAHEIIRKVADNLTLQIQERKGTLNLNLKAAKHKIIADDVHFSNIIFNLLDNAIKYSREDAPLQINLETVNNGSMFAIRVRDNGIGMNKETQARVFEKFYRAHTGNLHNVKGFGLGLSYVKAMVDAHHGRIKLESTLGKGSMFIVSFPASV